MENFNNQEKLLKILLNFNKYISKNQEQIMNGLDDKNILKELNFTINSWKFLKQINSVIKYKKIIELYKESKLSKNNKIFKDLVINFYNLIKSDKAIVKELKITYDELNDIKKNHKLNKTRTLNDYQKNLIINYLFFYFKNNSFKFPEFKSIEKFFYKINKKSKRVSYKLLIRFLINIPNLNIEKYFNLKLFDNFEVNMFKIKICKYLFKNLFENKN